MIADHMHLGTFVVYEYPDTRRGLVRETGRVEGVYWSEGRRKHSYMVRRDLSPQQSSWFDGDQLQEITEEFRDTYVETDPEILSTTEEVKDDVQDQSV